MKYKARVSKYSLSYCIILYCIASFEDLFKNLEPLESIDLQDDDHSNQVSRAKIKVKFTRDSSVKNTLSVDSTDKLTPVSTKIGHPWSRGD